MPDSTTLRVRYDAPATHRARAAWALEALMVRARVRDWELVPEDDEQPADLTLPSDPLAWAFTWDAEPDATRDPLAFTFWWLARVEERLAPDDAFDEHGRFRYDASALARRADPLAAPVDDLARTLADGPFAPWSADPDPAAPVWLLVPSHDIDLPWRWTPPGRRRALRSIRDNLRAGRVIAALRTLGQLAARPAWLLARSDPWHNARRIHRLERRAGAQSTSYVLVERALPEDGEQRLATHDATYLAQLRAATPDAIALHGSYATSTSDSQLLTERVRLEQRAGHEVRDHRFHYLRHRPVDAWPRLAAAGFTSDSSLGYAEQPALRAGTAHPFRAWDHAADRALDLVVIPLVLMDASYDARYLDLRDHIARERHARNVLDRVALLGGAASLLVHNDRLCNAADDGWTRLYRTLLRRVRATGGQAVTAAAAAAAYREQLPTHARAADPERTL